MKKKFFSKLLMGLLLLGTVSSYVSCKDYDDDIANLQSQIDAKATLAQLEDLKSQIAAAQSSASSALAAAEASLQAQINGKANAADLTAAKNELQAAIDAVKAEAKTAGEKTAADITAAANAAQEAAKAANAAQGTADAAADAAKKAQEAADAAAAAAKAADDKIAAAAAAATEQITKALEGVATKAELAALEAELKKLGEAHSDYVTAEDLQKEVEALKKLIAESTTPGETEGSDAKIEALQASVNALWNQMVTSVSLYSAAYAGNDFGTAGHKLYNVKFLRAQEVDNTKFPADKDDKYGVDKKYTNGEQFTFVKDRWVVANHDTIIIRVSPASAQLKPEMISLINSQGEAVPAELIEKIDVKPYTELLTRAGDNGLWKIGFKLVEEFDSLLFQETARFGEIVNNKDNKKDVLFAVAINSSADETTERRVVSEYDITLNEVNVQHAWDFNVNGTSVAKIHNRWELCDDKTPTNGQNGTDKVQELEWNDNAKPAIWEKIDLTEKTGNAGDRATGKDKRQGEPILGVKVGEKIKIEYPTTNDEYIRGFYVVLDYKFALESVPSELNAWNSYSYQNVGTMDKTGKEINPATLFEGNEGWITIEDMGDVDDDIIGFRVYAVNYDGTLVDPDGRAFYVHAGNEVFENDKTVVKVKVYSEDGKDTPSGNTGTTTVEKGLFIKNATAWDYAWATDNEISKDGKAWTKVTAGEKDEITNLFTFEFSADGKSWGSTPDQNTTQIRAKIKKASQLIDGKEYKVVWTGTKANTNYVVAKITVTVIKELPGVNEIPELVVRTGQEDYIWPVQVYMRSKTTAVNWDVDKADKLDYAYDIKPFNINNIFKGLKEDEKVAKYVDVKNYYLRFEKSDMTTDKDGKEHKVEASTFATEGYMHYLVKHDDQKLSTATQTVVDLLNKAHGLGTDELGYAIPYTYYTKVDGTNRHAYVNYNYGKLSLTKDKSNNPVLADVIREKNQFDVQYNCALDMSRLRLMTEKEILAISGNAYLQNNKTEAAAKAWKEEQYAVNYTETDKPVVYLNGGQTNGVGFLFWSVPAEDVLDALEMTSTVYADRSGIVDGIEIEGKVSDDRKASVTKFFDWVTDPKINALKITSVELAAGVKDYFVVDVKSEPKAEEGTYPVEYTYAETDKNKENPIPVYDYSQIFTDQYVALKSIHGDKLGSLLRKDLLFENGLTITFQDVFGHKTPLTLPVVIKKEEQK